MLVFGRKEGETIVIDSQVTLTIIRIDGNRVKVGIDAPKWIDIDRGEVAERKKEAAE